MEKILNKISEAIKLASGSKTQYISFGEKTLRISNHGANPNRADDNMVSLVVSNEDQSYRSDRGRTVTNWERSNQWYINSVGEFSEQFDSIESFLNYFDLA